MKKDFFRKVFVHRPVTWLKAAAVSTVLCMAILLVKGFDLPIYYVDALSVSGAITLGIGLLSLLSFLGAFDTMGYSVSTFKGEKRRYKDLYEYSQAKADRRSRQEWTFCTYLIVGAVFLIAGTVLNTIYL